MLYDINYLIPGLVLLVGETNCLTVVSFGSVSIASTIKR